jgi:hypothetical protein
LIVVVDLLHRTPGPVGATTTTVLQTPATSQAKGFPVPPPTGAVFTHQDGGTVLALAAAPSGRHLDLQASVVGQTGRGTSGLGITFAAAGHRATATACGAGCYRATLPSAGVHAIDVVVRGGGVDTTWHQALPTPWPAPDATAIVANATRTWRSLRSLAYVEHLASDPTHAVTSRWRVAAPDRAAYQVAGGYAGVIIGGRRWDKAPGGKWIESPQSALITQPVPFWVSFRNAHLIGTAAVGGRPAWVVSFFDPKSPAWYRILVDKRTWRTLRMQMMTTAHFMHDSYSAFDRATPITPP